MLLFCGVALAEKKDWQTLAKELVAVDHISRARAAKSLGKLGDKRALPMLLAATYDSHALVRGIAVTSIADIGGMAAIDVIETIAKDDPEEAVRLRATNAVKRLGEQKKTMDGKKSKQPPVVHITFRSVADETASKSESTARQREKLLRQLLVYKMTESGELTSDSVVAAKKKLQTVGLDVSIADFHAVAKGKMTTYQCKIKASVSDNKDRIKFLVHSKAETEILTKDIKPEILPYIYQAVFSRALEVVHDDIVRQLQVAGTSKKTKKSFSAS